MGIVLPDSVEENREGINTEKLGNGELSHHNGEG